MNSNMTNSQQLRWILAETWRQLGYPVRYVSELIASYRESQELDRRLERALVDPGLIDRVLAGTPAPAVCYPILPVEVEERLGYTRELRVVRKSLDGILAV